MVHQIVTTIDLQTKNTGTLSPLRQWPHRGSFPGTRLLGKYTPSKAVLINVNESIIISQSRYYMKLLANLNSCKPEGHTLAYNYNGK